MKVTAVVTIDFEADRFDVTDPSIEIVREVALVVAQAIRHQSAAPGVDVRDVRGVILDANGDVLAPIGTPAAVTG